MIYTIPKGWHYCYPSIFGVFGFTCENKINGTIDPLEGFDYDYEGQDDFDTSKIIGLSDDYNHLKNSARIGWRKNRRNEFECVAIVHNNRKIKTRFICRLPLTKFTFRIVIDKGFYYFSVNDMKIRMERTSDWNSIRYKLAPYAGGDSKAKQKMKIRIE